MYRTTVEPSTVQFVHGPRCILLIPKLTTTTIIIIIITKRRSAMLGRHSNMSIGWVIHQCSRLRDRKEEKYADLDSRYIFEPIATETLGVFNTSACQLLFDLGWKITESTCEATEESFLFQRCSVIVQRFNATLLYDSLPAQDCIDWMTVLHFVFRSTFKLHRDYICRGLKK